MALDLEALRNKQARRGARGWSPKEGDNLIRFLPHTTEYFTGNVSDIAFQFRSHFLKAPGNDTTVVRCLRDDKRPCSFCELVAKLKESTNPVHKALVDDIKGGERHLFNILNLNDIAAGVQTYESGPKVYDDVLAFVANPAWGDMISPSDGRNWSMHLQKTGTRSGFYEYKLQPHPDRTDMTPHLPADWKDKLDNCEAQIPAYPDDATVARWMDILTPGSSVPAPAAAVPGTPTATWTPPPTAAAPAVPAWNPAAAVPPAPAFTAPESPAAVFGGPPLAAAPSAPPTPPPHGSPVADWAAANGLAVTTKFNTEVPQCFSDGPNTGFNPAKFPCDKGCPKRADCQLKSLGLG